MNELKHNNDAGRIEVDSDGIALLTLNMEGSANKINETFGRGLENSLKWLAEQDGIKGLVITSGKKDFCVGADIDKMFVERDPEAIFERVQQLNQLFRAIETQKFPVVCALNGSALGGGFELALACHHRIAVDSPKIQLGLPEVNLGVIPGAGGTQRLPRLVGQQTALEYIAAGKMVRPSRAKKDGLINDIAEDADALLAKAKAWIKDNPKAKAPWDTDGWRLRPNPAGEDIRNLLMGASAMMMKKTAGAYEAPKAAIAAVHEGCLLSFERGLEVESRYFTKLAVGDQAKDMMRTLWFHRTAAEKQEGLPKTENIDIQKVGILGAGMMGAGLAFVSAEKGFDVVLKDINQDALDKGMAHAEAEAKKMKWLSEEERKTILGRITPTLELAPLEGCDLVIEAVIENIDIKHAVIKETEGMLKNDTGIWASNTSALPIDDLVTASQIPERFIGLHFFSPVEKMPLIEIIMGEKTNEETLARCLAYAKKIKKTPIVVNDGYGFYTSRVFSAYILEAANLVAEGHEPALVEWAARSAGMVVPPLQVFDEVTLKLGRHGLEMGEKYLGQKLDFPGVALIKKMVDELERYGKSTGAGFYEYEDGRRKGLWKGLADLKVGTPAAEESTLEAIRDRLLLIQVAEVLRLVEGGIIRDKRDAEVGAIFGIGFAPNTGGPLSYVDRKGARWIVNRLRELTSKYGERYTPCKMIEEMAEKDETFFDRV